MTCKWTEDKYGLWETECGNAHEFVARGSTPSDEGFTYCPFCRRVLRQQVYDDRERPGNRHPSSVNEDKVR